MGGVIASPPVLSKAKKKPNPLVILPVDPNLSAKAKTYWATVYTVTGEKVARAFVSEDGDDKVIFARPITDSELAVDNRDTEGSEWSEDSILTEVSTVARDEDKGVVIDLPTTSTSSL